MNTFPNLFTSAGLEHQSSNRTTSDVTPVFKKWKVLGILCYHDKIRYRVKSLLLPHQISYYEMADGKRHFKEKLK